MLLMINDVIKIPTINSCNGKFYISEFNKNDWIKLLETEIFKEPGLYNLNKTTTKYFRKEAANFEEKSFYTEAPFKSIDYIEYWEHQKLLCRNGLLLIDGDNKWYVPRDYYFWLNFLPIYRKDVKRYGFPDIIDFQLHMALYEYIAELKGLHAAILKKRQCASSYFHAAKLINQLWFEQGVILKTAAFAELYIQQFWQYANEYRNFLNEHTAWYRPMQPDTYKHWQQRFEKKTSDGKKIFSGNKGELIGIIADTVGTKSVSGSCRYFFHEEGGISPIMLELFEYILPALKDGDLYTGQFIAAGSVGELEHAVGLRELILNPDIRDVYAIKTKFYDVETPERTCALFIPEQWGMRPYIDEYGNSLVEDAIKALLEHRKKWKEELSFEKYQLRVSQAPMYITEAFNYRKESRFPLEIIRIQESRIAEKKVPYEYVDLIYNADGKVDAVESKRMPILEVPVPMNLEDKRACVVVYERPIPNLKFGSYIASIDPVSSGKTITSDSLASLYVYRMPTIVKTKDIYGNMKETAIEGDKIVCSYCGRYDDMTETFDMLLKIIEWYNAYTLVENNSWNFIQHMIYKRKQHYLIPSTQILFTKELNVNTMTFKEYGYSTTNQLFNNHFVPYLIDYIKEKIGEEKIDDINKRTIFGIERIPDIMALEEMKKFYELKNKDRLISLGALVSYVKVLTSNYGYMNIEKTDSNLQNTQKNSNFNIGHFNNFKYKNINPYKGYFKNYKL